MEVSSRTIRVDSEDACSRRTSLNVECNSGQSFVILSMSVALCGASHALSAIRKDDVSARSCRRSVGFENTWNSIQKSVGGVLTRSPMQ
jgi:hypothetical protein